jgi:hypothetical protein
MFNWRNYRPRSPSRGCRVIIGVVAAAVVAALIELLALSGNRKRRQQAPQDHPEQP